MSLKLHIHYDMSISYENIFCGVRFLRRNYKFIFILIGAMLCFCKDHCVVAYYTLYNVFS